MRAVMNDVVEAQGFANPLCATIAADMERVEQVLAETLSTPRPGISRLTQHLEQYRGNLDLSREQYFDIIDAKTAELTACCCRLGALYAGANDGVVAALTRYGRALGTAFQIADDVLDLVGHEKTVGKSLGTDVEQQK